MFTAGKEPCTIDVDNYCSLFYQSMVRYIGKGYDRIGVVNFINVLIRDLRDGNYKLADAVVSEMNNRYGSEIAPFRFAVASDNISTVYFSQTSPLSFPASSEDSRRSRKDQSPCP